MSGKRFKGVTEKPFPYVPHQLDTVGPLSDGTHIYETLNDLRFGRKNKPEALKVTGHIRWALIGDKHVAVTWNGSAWTPVRPSNRTPARIHPRGHSNPYTDNGTSCLPVALIPHTDDRFPAATLGGGD